MCTGSEGGCARSEGGCAGSEGGCTGSAVSHRRHIPHHKVVHEDSAKQRGRYPRHVAYLSRRNRLRPRAVATTNNHLRDVERQVRKKENNQSLHTRHARY